MKFYKNIFSIRNENYHKIIKFFGLKIKIRRLPFNEISQRFDNINFAIVNLHIKTNILQNIHKSYLSKDFFDEPIMPYNRCYIDTKISYINYLFKNLQGTFDNKDEMEKSPNFFYTCGIFPNDNNTNIIINALKFGKQVYIIEDGFLRSIFSVAYKHISPRYQKSISFTIDDLTAYYDANFPSRLELMLNDKDLVISNEQKERAKKCIKKITDTYLTKYNNQPICKLNLFKQSNRKKFLSLINHMEMPVF
ncbi:MAG: hypothetical protein E7043_07915 [Lentisphaerae bacterium]|nr:hypothetical protein [Lentisphaerota bacterium]